MSGKEQAKLLGLLFWIFCGLQLLVVALIGVMYMLFAGVIVATAERKANEPDPAIMLPIILIVLLIVGGIFLLSSLPKIVAGYGLRKEKSWARPWAIVACVMACMSFPLGTAVGVYGLIFLLGDAGKAYFNNPAYGTLGGQTGTAPPPNSWQ